MYSENTESIFQVNVLIDENRRAVIGDFGICLVASGRSENYYSARSGNTYWFAPELFGEKSSVRPTKYSDVYSFAMLCIEVCIHDMLLRSCLITLSALHR